MSTKICAVSAVLLSTALAGCATTGTQVFATTGPLVAKPAGQAELAPPMTNGNSGVRYRVFPGDGTKGSF